MVDDLVEVHPHLWRLHGLIEDTDAVVVVDAEEAHGAGVHPVLPLVLVLLYLLVGTSDGDVVFLVLQIELTLLRDVAHGDGDELQLSILVVDGVDAHLCIAIDATFRNDGLRTVMVLFYRLLTDDVP